MHGQTINPETYFEGTHIWKNNVDPSTLSVIDFYCWSLEQSEGSLEQAVRTLNSPEEALKFAMGMHQDKVALAGRAHCGNNETAIGDKITEALTEGMDKSAQSATEIFRANRIWVQALNEFYGVNDELYELAGKVTSGLDKAVRLASSAGNSLEAIIELSKESVLKKFSYTEENLYDLNLLAEGTELKDHMEDAGITKNEAKNRRKQSVTKLGVNTTPHAIRRGLEEGLIEYESPTDEKTAVELNEFDTEVLELYSRGHYETDIATKKGVSIGLIAGRLDQMMLLFSAKNRWHVIKRGFEVGALTPDHQTPHAQLGENLRGVSQLEQKLVKAREYIERFGAPQSLQTDSAPETEETSVTADSLNPNQVWIEYQRAQENISTLSESGARITDSIFDLLKRTHHSIKPVITPFNESERTELELASQGVRLSERTSDGATRMQMTGDRLSMLEKTGTKSFANTIRQMVESGYLPVEWTHPEKQVSITAPTLLKLLSVASKGAGRPDELDNNSRIAAAVTGNSDQSIRPMIRQLKELLGGNDWASLIRRAYEEGVLVSTGPLGNLQKAQQTSVLSQMDANRIHTSLSKLSPEEVVAHLFPPPPKHKGKPLSVQLKNELLQLAAGASTKDRAKSEGIKSLDTIRSRRGRLMGVLGVQTTTEAVDIGIRKELIPLKLTSGHKPVSELDPYMVDVFFDLSKGALIQEIAGRKGMPPSTLSRHLSAARKNLSASSNEHAIKRLYEERYFSIN